MGQPIENFLPGIRENGLITKKTVDFSGAPSVALPSGTTINGASATPNNITSNSANSFTVGPNGTTNPVLKVDSSTASQAAGLKLTGAVTGGTVALLAIDSGSNTSITVDGKGTGTIGINTLSTTSGLVTIGNSTSLAGVAVNGPLTSAAVTVTSASANAFAVGPNGTTNPSLNIDASTASAATGLNIKPAAAAGGLVLSVISSNATESITISSKSTGAVILKPGGNGSSAIQFQQSGGTTVVQVDTTNKGLYVTSAWSGAFAVGLAGSSNPAFKVDSSAGLQAAGVLVAGAATGGTVAISAIDSGSNTSLTIDGKGTGTVGINTVSTTSGLVTIGNSTALAGVAVNGAVGATGVITAVNGLATPSNSATGKALSMGSAGINVYFGSGAPSFSAAHTNDIYIR